MYQDLGTLACQVYPHKISTPCGNDPYGFDIVDDPSGEPREIIQSACTMVEMHITAPERTNGLPRGATYTVVTVYPDDATEREFSSSREAAEYFLMEQFRMNLSCQSLDIWIEDWSADKQRQLKSEGAPRVIMWDGKRRTVTRRCARRLVASKVIDTAN